MTKDIWNNWNGGECPVGGNTCVRVLIKGVIEESLASIFYWEATVDGSDIDAFAIMEDTKDVWIRWDGGECPVDDSTHVRVKMRNIEPTYDNKGHPADQFYWTHHTEGTNGFDIVKYLIVREVVECKPKWQFVNKSGINMFHHMFFDDVNVTLTYNEIGYWVVNLNGIPVIGQHNNQYFPNADYAKEWVEDMIKSKQDALYHMDMALYGGKEHGHFSLLTTRSKS